MIYVINQLSYHFRGEEEEWKKELSFVSFFFLIQGPSIFGHRKNFLWASLEENVVAWIFKVKVDKTEVMYLENALLNLIPERWMTELEYVVIAMPKGSASNIYK